MRFEDRTYDLSGRQTVDLFVSYRDGHEDIAHTFLSFGFADGRRLCVSVEVRREADETYDTLKGIFKQFEIIYVFADERDVVELRTNHREEDVYLYRMTCSPADARRLRNGIGPERAPRPATTSHSTYAIRDSGKP